MGWTTAAIPDLSGRTYVVTGANTGLGLETARVLAAHGGRVILACRNWDKGEAAQRELGGETELRLLDLADLDSVREFAAQPLGPVDVLINNAGVMFPPLQRTAQGFELQFGTNVLGHFLLTNLLLPQITDRVVTLASLMHRAGRIVLDDLNWNRRPYNPAQAYGQSKLADLMFALELQRRLTAKGSPLRSLAAHPGWAATELQTRPGQGRLMNVTGRLGTKIPLAQTSAQGAEPTLYAATAPQALGGGYYGPGRLFGMKGAPELASLTRAARDETVARTLWERCEELTGQPFVV